MTTFFYLHHFKPKLCLQKINFCDHPTCGYNYDRKLHTAAAINKGYFIAN